MMNLNQGEHNKHATSVSLFEVKPDACLAKASVNFYKSLTIRRNITGSLLCLPS